MKGAQTNMMGSGQDSLQRRGDVVATAVDTGCASILELFHAQVVANPDATAVVFEDEQTSYQRLNEAANRLAHRLISDGVGPENIVAVRMRRSTDMVVALLATMKAGAAYLPVDPEYPEQRQHLMLESSGASAVITDDAVMERFPTIIFSSRSDEDMALSWTSNPVVPVHGGNVAYCIYTSGSTGVPKGVCVSHEALLNHTQWMIREYGIGSRDVVLQRTSISFDASVWELWTPLCVGGRLVVLSSAAQRHPLAILSTVRSQGVTVAQFVPSILREVLRSPMAKRAGWRLVFCGGERLDAGLVRDFRSSTRARLVNLYGPTEATIDATHWEVDLEADQADPPIGRAIDSVELFVLTDQMREVPPGAVGELYIAGRALARGYLRKPAETAERFVPNPFRHHGNRLYRTGDLVRVNINGALEYCGRVDRQIKINGHRVEIGEIESAIVDLAGAEQAVVHGGSSEGARTALVAFVKPKRGTAPIDEIALLDELKRRLPSFMLPSRLVAVDRFPVGPNGKIDLEQLPFPDRASQSERLGPSTQLEQALCEIWGTVLRHEAIGVQETFASLGGDSLDAMSVIARIGARFRVAVSFQDFLDNPTVEKLASLVEGRPEDATPGIETHSAEEWAIRSGSPVSQPSMAQVEILQKTSAPAHLENVVMAYRVTGHLDLPALRAALDRVLRAHDSLRMGFVVGNDGETWIRQIEDGAVCEPRIIEIVDNPSCQIRERWATLIDEELRTPFDLARPPLIRVSVATIPNDACLLLICVHHIVFDGWSTAILIGELETAYGEAIEAPVLVSNGKMGRKYSQYSDWQRYAFRSGLIDEQIEFWTRELAALPPPLALRGAKARPEAFTYEIARTAFDLNDVSDRIDDCCRRLDVTVYTLLLSAYFCALARHCDSTDLYVRSPVANRSDLFLEDAIGYFVHPIIIRMDARNAQSSRVLAQVVSEKVVAAYQRQGLPPSLMESLCSEKPADSGSRFPFWYNHHNYLHRRLHLYGTQIESLPAPSVGIKTDLSLSTWRSPEGICGSIAYCPDIYSEPVIAGLLGDFKSALLELLECG